MSQNNKSGRDSRDTLDKDLANMKDKFYETGDAIRQTASHATDNAKSLAKTAIKDARETYKDAKGQVVEVEENLIRYIKKNPIKAVGIGFLAGLIASVFI